MLKLAGLHQAVTVVSRGTHGHPLAASGRLGKTSDFGKLMGLDNAWAFNIIKQVGNYGESYERNVGKGSALELDRGPKALWGAGGLMYAIPFR